MYFSAKDKGEMMSMIYNWPAHQVCRNLQCFHYQFCSLSAFHVLDANSTTKLCTCVSLIVVSFQVTSSSKAHRKL